MAKVIQLLGAILSKVYELRKVFRTYFPILDFQVLSNISGGKGYNMRQRLLDKSRFSLLI
jgi:hypothetical protein